MLSVYKDFLECYFDEVKKLKVGNYQDIQVDIGPINRKSELKKFLDILYDAKPDEIVMGGRIDLKENIVEPTVIVRDLVEGANFEEVFGPITFIHPYMDDRQLSLYFHDTNGVYKRNKMYVSLYGTSSYISTRNDQDLAAKSKGVGIVLDGKTIHDYERGDRPYGGYSIGASAVFLRIIQVAFVRAQCQFIFQK